MKNIRLFDYQEDMRLRIVEAFKSHQSVMAQMPTGTGKTHLLAAIVQALVRQQPKPCVWIVAHRRELVAQIEATLSRFGISPTDKRVKALSVQWLARHEAEIELEPSLIVIDEAHHALAKTYKQMWERFPKAKFLGLTATPCRLSGKGFTDLFEVLVQSWDIPEFIKQGRLATYDFVSIKTDSVTQGLIESLKKRGADGDYQTMEMDRVLNKRPSIERLYRSFVDFAKDKKGIVYAINISHARKIAEFYQEHGVVAVAIDSKTPATERQVDIAAFKKGDIQVLVNVDIFSEGFDCPDVEFVQLARPTLSLAKYLQMVGRGLRVAKGKKCCVMIDNVGLYRVFGLPSQAWDWKAMFEGRLNRKQLQKMVEMNLRMDAAVAQEDEKVMRVYDPEMTVVMTHEKLGWMVTDGNQGDETAMLRERLLQGEFGKVKKMRHDVVKLYDKRGFVNYVDLRNMKKFPVDDKCTLKVRSFGDIDVIELGAKTYTRTHKVFGTAYGCKEYQKGDFFLVLDANGTASKCVSLERYDGGEVDAPVRYSHEVCVISDDDSQYYWLAGKLSEDRLVIMDSLQNYYLQERGKKKLFLAQGEKKILALIPQLKREETRRQRQQEKERQEYIRALESVVPYQVDRKWGLKGCDGTMLTPPLYSAIRTEVHRLFAFAVAPFHWGVMSRDGQVLIEPKYEQVKIEGAKKVVVTDTWGNVQTILVNNPYRKR